EAVEPPDGVGRHGGVGELRERKPARTTRDPVDAEADADPGIDLDEQGTQLVFGGLETKIADENGGRNGTPPQCPKCGRTIAACRDTCEPRSVTRARARSECCPSVLRRGRCRPHRSGASTPGGGPGTPGGSARTRPTAAASRTRPCSAWPPRRWR